MDILILDDPDRVPSLKSNLIHFFKISLTLGSFFNFSSWALNISEAYKAHCDLLCNVRYFTYSSPTTTVS